MFMHLSRHGYSDKSLQSRFNNMSTKYIFPSRLSSLSKLNRILSGKDYKNSKFYIILDENTYNNCLPPLVSSVSALEKAEFFEVPTGENAKSLEVANQLWQALLESESDRNSVIINLGGGCVCDLGGFVAAGFKRGIRYINIPTTLIAMVDAAIGGKTAVNIGNEKNQVGFFHQPSVVCYDFNFLKTLPSDELKNGLFELIKSFFLCGNTEVYELLKLSWNYDDASCYQDFIPHCVEFKRSIVNADPQEHSLRKILNFGHTFGHGIESHLRAHGHPVSHGYAVGIGMACELYLSVKKLGMGEKLFADYCSFLRKLIQIPKFNLRDTESILSFMRHDKKNNGGLILCVLLQSIGVPLIDVALDENEVRDALLHVCKC